MKINASIVTKAALMLSIAAGVASCGDKKTADKTAAAPASTVTASPESTAPQIVFVNQDSLVAKYEYIKDMDKRLDSKGKAAQNDVAARQQAIQRQIADYQRNQATMSADQRATTEQQLQRKGAEFQQYQQNAGVQVQNEQVNEQTKLYDKLVEFTKSYAKEKGYKMVLTFKKGDPTMLYGDATLDVTSDVVKRLNDEYAKTKK